VSSVAFVDFNLRRLVRREADAIAPTVLPRDMIVRRRVLDACELRHVPADLAHYYASQAAQIVRSNPTRETSSVADNAVRQAVDAMRRRSPDNGPFVA
jgi:hypothetical protein